jgi:multicomponent Na+:H+ antiporter subunit G
VSPVPIPIVTVGDALALTLVVTSVAFSAIAVIGFARLPDVFARAHAASKSETLGVLAGLAAAAVAFGTAAELVKLAMLALFVLATGPTAAHAIVRAAALAGATPWTRDDDPTGVAATGADGGAAGVTPPSRGESP